MPSHLTSPHLSLWSCLLLLPRCVSFTRNTDRFERLHHIKPQLTLPFLFSFSSALRVKSLKKKCWPGRRMRVSLSVIWLLLSMRCVFVWHAAVCHDCVRLGALAREWTCSSPFLYFYPSLSLSFCLSSPSFLFFLPFFLFSLFPFFPFFLCLPFFFLLLSFSSCFSHLVFLILSFHILSFASCLSRYLFLSSSVASRLSSLSTSFFLSFSLFSYNRSSLLSTRFFSVWFR